MWHAVVRTPQSLWITGITREQKWIACEFRSEQNKKLSNSDEVCYQCREDQRALTFHPVGTEGDKNHDIGTCILSWYARLAKP